jgi:hypothetical protein
MKNGGWIKYLVGLLILVALGAYVRQELRLSRLEERTRNHLDYIREDVNVIQADIKRLLAR